MAVRTDDPITARAREIAEREHQALQERTPASGRLFQRAVRSLPMGVASTFQAADPYPIYLDRGSGSRVWDVDGNEYVDFHSGFGVNVVGHAHPKIVDAITKAASSGTHFAVSDTSTWTVAHGVTATATLTLWAFLGLECATIPAGAIRDAERTIPRARLAHRLFEKPHIHVEPHDVDVPVLLTAQQVSSAAQL